MYNIEFDLTDEQLDPEWTLPIGKAGIERQGKDVSIVAHSKIVGNCLEAAKILADKHGIDAEVINLRSIRPLDRSTIIESVKKTNHIVSVEEGWPQHGIGAEIAALMMESEAFDYLDAPLERVTGAEIPIPYSYAIEKMAVAQTEDIVNSALKTL